MKYFFWGLLFISNVQNDACFREAYIQWLSYRPPMKGDGADPVPVVRRMTSTTPKNPKTNEHDVTVHFAQAVVDLDLHDDDMITAPSTSSDATAEPRADGDAGYAGSDVESDTECF